MTDYDQGGKQIMKTENLLCTFQGASAIDSPAVDKRLKKLKTHEIRNLTSFCRIMSTHGFSYRDYDGQLR